LTRKRQSKPEESPRPRDEDEVEIVSVDAVDSAGRPFEGEEEIVETVSAPDHSGEEPEALAAPGAGAETEELRERWLRARADLENYRKRVERDREQMIARAGESILTALLPVLDDLDRALAVGGGEEGLKEGVQLIARSLVEVLGRHGLERVPAEGETFDPHLHEAGEIEPTERVPAQTVVAELRAGYRMGDRLLRPALVRVAVAPEREEVP
jgi:molecular chaperone GrpE